MGAQWGVFKNKLYIAKYFQRQYYTVALPARLTCAASLAGQAGLWAHNGLY
jgi:hypothetical protein